MPIMTQDAFYEAFPWMLKLPTHPRCEECGKQSFMQLGEEPIMIEFHTSLCSRIEFDGEKHKL